MDEYQTIVSLKNPTETMGFHLIDTFLLMNSFLMQNPQIGPENTDNWMYHKFGKQTLYPSRIRRYFDRLTAVNIVPEAMFREVNLHSHLEKLDELGLIKVADYVESDEGPDTEIYDLAISRELSGRVFDEIEQLKTPGVPSEILIEFRQANPFYRGDKSFFERLKIKKPHN